ncbi:hypothetical protein [Pseudomonas zanjanensis]|uniref:hypothetical protein n=1 Tax=Pseudomonas zanjanensis TaxID=2745496 RepID=UPI001CECEE34|nr:hypothetical protein [Pseudomonas zanjanensis]
MDSATDQTPAKSFVFDHWLLQSDGTLMRDGQGVHVPPKKLHVLQPAAEVGECSREQGKAA